jgi:16S rRNA (guanine527-N7)-methyltransferase
MVNAILQYFPELSDQQVKRFHVLKEIYSDWNSRINVISRKDFDNFYIHHVLHSLSVAKFICFKSGTKVMDAGTGGGFPGIPLAIMFPETNFSLIDSLEKKIKVVASVADKLNLTNVAVICKRLEDESGKYDFIISRAVTSFPGFIKLVHKNIEPGNLNTQKNGIICLKGGELSGELGLYYKKIKIINISDFFSEPYFETKKIVYLPV